MLYTVREFCSYVQDDLNGLIDEVAGITRYGSDEENIIGGWGDHLGCFFDEKKVVVRDYAQAGRSTRDEKEISRGRQRRRYERKKR